MIALSKEARRLLQQHSLEIWRATDRFFGWLLIVEWIALVVIAAVASPRAWSGLESSVHPHVWIAIFLGGLVVLPPLVLIHFRPGKAETRHVVAIGQSLVSAILIHLTGGRIESHFHIFGSLACLSFYRDWRVLVTATVVTAVDHGARGVLWPTSVFGIASMNSWRWIEHVHWVLYEDFFLIYACRRSLNEMSEIAQREAEAALGASRMERLIDERTALLRQSEQNLRLSRDRAEEANIAKSEFLANMSHEIRTPMSAILGYADLLLESGDLGRAPIERMETIQTIRRNGHHLLDVINDILDLSRIESGKIQLETVTCSPWQVLSEVRSLMRMRAQEKNIQLTLDCDGAMPATVQCDPLRIRQILVNLVGNAIKFTERGSVRIVARYLPAPEQQIEFDVIDTGIGIDDDVQKRLFQPFVQADSSMTRRFGGTGLGLAISLRIAKLLGGDLGIAYSQIGVGTCLRCRIPVQQVSSETEEIGTTAIAPPPPIVPAASVALQPLEDVRILVVDDGPDIQRLLVHYLKRAGAVTDVAHNGRQAVEAALSAQILGTSFDVILMDMQMPEMDGYEATRLLRSRNYEGIIVASTAHAMAGDREKCVEAGCNDYVSKPIERAQLISTIIRCLAATSSSTKRLAALTLAGSGATG